MLELAQQPRQPHNQCNSKPGIIGAGFEEMQHQRFQVLAKKMHARLTNANSEIERDVFELFCKRMLPVTFFDWMCKP